METTGNSTDYGSERIGANVLVTSKKRGHIDLPFAMLTLLLLVIGVIMVLSASFARAYYDIERETSGVATYYFRRQLLFALTGIAIMYAASHLPIVFYRHLSFLIFAGSVFLLVLVLFSSYEGGGARRWINLGFTTFQPSEVTKIGVVLYFATLICKYKEDMVKPRALIPFVVCLGVVIALLALEPHVSATVIIIIVGAVMLFIGGVQLKWFVLGGIACAVLAALALMNMSHLGPRIASWRDPFGNLKTHGWQIVQSLYAVGSGGLLGQGLGQSRQKYLYLPEEHNDFIFSVVCEELGFIGAVLILILFALLICRGYYLAMHAQDRYSFLVCVGLTTLLAVQVILNVAVITNLVPCTGISLPFFSYGGTALWIQLGQMGIILSISRDIPNR